MQPNMNICNSLQ